MKGNRMSSGPSVAICFSRMLGVACLLTMARQTLANTELLLTIPAGAVSDSDAPLTELTVTLFFGGPRGPIPVPPWPVRYGELSLNVFQLAPGSYAFNSTNTSTFVEFAALACNGNADDILVEGVERIPYFSGSYSADTEHSYHWNSLPSYAITEVRLVIDTLHISPDLQSYEIDHRWDVWGYKVPEPSTTCCVITFLLLASRRRLRRAPLA